MEKNEHLDGPYSDKPAGNTEKSVRKPPVNNLNDLTAKEWLPETVSVWTQRGLGKGHKDAEIEREHPAPFSFQDVGRLIRFFTKEGATVLDPFVGVGSTLKACALLGRKGIGIELNPKYTELAKKRLQLEVADASSRKNQKILVGDARTVLKKLVPESVKLIITSPPYWNILHKKDHKARQERIANGLDTQYSGSKSDLGNIAKYDDFLQVLADTLNLACEKLTKKGHLCVIVSDFRHKSKYYMFHSDLAREMEARGLTLKGITVLYQRHKRIFPYGYPYSFVPNLHHQYIVILEK